jgi:RHS repeat-associated protein
VHEDPVTKSKRVTDVNGSVVSAIELDPWGADTNRSSNAAFQPKKFTSYDRDANGSDEAMFRRFNRKHSRFDQPDPYDGSYSLTDPQSFNRYSYVQNDPVNFTDPSGLDALSQGITSARNVLQGSACRSLFRGRDPVNLLDAYVKNGLIEVNSRPLVPGRPTQRGHFRDGNVGAATSVATASLTTPSGVIQTASTITVNRNGFFFSLRTTNGVDIRRVSEFRGLSDAQVRGAVIVHELAHAAGVILSDGHDPAQSQRNSMLVKIFCFSSLNNPNAPIPQVRPTIFGEIGGGGGGDSISPTFHGGGGEGGFDSLRWLDLWFASMRSGGGYTEVVGYHLNPPG